MDFVSLSRYQSDVHPTVAVEVADAILGAIVHTLGRRRNIMDTHQRTRNLQMDRRDFFKLSTVGIIGTTGRPGLTLDAAEQAERTGPYEPLAAHCSVLWKASDPNLLGVPFYSPGRYEHPTSFRGMAQIGWGETNLVQITDPENIWFDPNGRTFHLLSRAVTGCTNLACLAKAVSSEDGSRITVSLQEAPSGNPMLYVPLPGGQVSFHIAYDEPTRLFWMVSSQATDSMKRVELLHPKRYNMPNQERHRLVLHFSRNCIDWCFAGVVAKVDDVGQSHHGGNMVIDGDDLQILMRTADAAARNAHNSNLITFHTIRNFRDLRY